MTNIDPATLRALLAAATPGPWHMWDGATCVGRKRYPHVSIGVDLYKDNDVATLRGERQSADAALIVAAVNALPALLDAVMERDRLRQYINEALEDLGCGPGEDLCQRADSLRGALADAREERDSAEAERDRLRARVAELEELVRESLNYAIMSDFIRRARAALEGGRDG